MWSSVSSSDRLSGVSLTRDSSDTVTPPSVAFRRRPRTRRQLPIVDVTHPTLASRTSRPIDLHKGSPREGGGRDYAAVCRVIAARIGAGLVTFERLTLKG